MRCPARPAASWFARSGCIGGCEPGGVGEGGGFSFDLPAERDDRGNVQLAQLGRAVIPSDVSLGARGRPLARHHPWQTTSETGKSAGVAIPLVNMLNFWLVRLTKDQGEQP